MENYQEMADVQKGLLCWSKTPASEGKTRNTTQTSRVGILLSRGLAKLEALQAKGGWGHGQGPPRTENPA